MSCSNKKYQKSAVRTYNNTAQTVTEDLTTAILQGSICTNTGCSLTPGVNSITVNNTGLYYIEADITFTPTAAGTSIIQLYKDNVALPCAIAQDTTEANNIFTTHIETVLQVSTCCQIQPSFSVQLEGVAGDINFIGMTMIKLA